MGVSNLFQLTGTHNKEHIHMSLACMLYKRKGEGRVIIRKLDLIGNAILATNLPSLQHIKNRLPGRAELEPVPPMGAAATGRASTPLRSFRPRPRDDAQCPEGCSPSFRSLALLSLFAPADGSTVDDHIRHDGMVPHCT